MAMSPRPSPLRLVHVALVIAAMMCATGCPRQPDAPDPGMGEPCESLEACNPGISCGLLRLCVEGFCEDEATLVRACRERGEPLPSDG